ncbi:hypothetical protein Mgra_00006540 [Meloidogyne graminicola]|uniref:Uncharacterized protein n=1 Tax=Meloidogyne graminicola TaxID=189291 RepID=A0A8S9ZLK8_9BILA|nr:hypothetical protein Mgra_00006540 [Meloidogyne graminicola]
MKNNNYSNNYLRPFFFKKYINLLIIFIFLIILNTSEEVKIKRTTDNQNKEGVKFVDINTIRQKRWIPITEEELNEEVNNEQYPFIGSLASKREVSESELNSLLKNAWLGR